jgi:hypothetical protein
MPASIRRRCAWSDSDDHARHPPHHHNEDAMNQHASMTHVDGNAVTAALSLALGADMSTAALQCAACGSEHHVAQCRVYLRCPGIVLRCPDCSGAEIVLVEIAHRFRITMPGTATLHIVAPSPQLDLAHQ